MSEVAEKDYDFNDDAKQIIMKYNAESDESDAEDRGEEQELTSYGPCVENSCSLSVTMIGIFHARKESDVG